MTGMFSHQTRSHRGPGRQAIARRNQGMRRDLSIFAEAIAEGSSLAEAGRAIGVSGQRSSQLFAKMRRDLGWQAQ